MIFDHLQSININIKLNYVHIKHRKGLILITIMTILLLNRCKCQQLAVNHSSQERPEFVKNIPNLSIVTGKDAVMRCSVKNLGHNMISWRHLESNSDLTINKQILSSDPRIKVKQENDDWLLIINNVSLEDKGFYICRINWPEPNSQLGYLNVVEPPRFYESSFTSGTESTVREHDNLTLICRATGNPSPTVEWRREDGRSIYQSSPKGLHPESSGVPKNIGEQLSFQPITRWDMGSYLCIASNGVPPSISRQIMIHVQFAPVIRVPSISVTGTLGADVTLTCSSESSPIADHTWINQHGIIIVPPLNATIKSKYRVKLIKTYSFKVTYQLIIVNLTYSDSGVYFCHVNNSLGSAQSSITLEVKDYSPIKSPVDNENGLIIDEMEESEGDQSRKTNEIINNQLPTRSDDKSWTPSIVIFAEVDKNQAIGDFPMKQSTDTCIAIVVNTLLITINLIVSEL